MESTYVAFALRFFNLHPSRYSVFLILTIGLKCRQSTTHVALLLFTLGIHVIKLHAIKRTLFSLLCPFDCTKPFT